MGNILAEAARYRVNIPDAFMHDHEWDGAYRGRRERGSRWINSRGARGRTR